MKAHTLDGPQHGSLLGPQCEGLLGETVQEHEPFDGPFREGGVHQDCPLHSRWVRVYTLPTTGS